MIKSVFISTLLMYGLWLLLSGHYTPLLLSLGLASALGVSLIAYRMRVLDEEGLPMAILPRLPKVAVWLIWEILCANLEVIKIILQPKKASAGLVRVKTSQRTVAGLVTYANFITLTPGTVSMQVDESKMEILVHGLTQDFCAAVLDPAMDKRVSALEKPQKKTKKKPEKKLAH